MSANNDDYDSALLTHRVSDLTILYMLNVITKEEYIRYSAIIEDHNKEFRSNLKDMLLLKSIL